MSVIAILMKRNMMLFFKDKSALFFSFMAVFIVLFLYICFLGDMMIKPLKAPFPDTAREISDTWIMAGTLGIVSLTTSLSVLGIVIEDKQHHILDDFRISPISRMQISVAYICSTIVITFLISTVTLGIAEMYILAYGGKLLDIVTFMKLFGIMLLSILSCTSMLYFIMSFFNSASSFSNITTIIGTLSGFLMGIYVPIGSLPHFLQVIIAWFPPSHGAALFRNVMMEDVLQRSFPAGQETALLEFKKQFGLVFEYGTHTTTLWDNMFVLIGMGVFFFILLRFQKREK
ncbi:ABC transporter permease [Amedibacillus sp. YH-ame10]